MGALLGSLYWISQRYASAIGVSRLESQTPTRTGFSAIRDGAGWKLTWDSAAVEALEPTGATLSIQDGAGEQDIPFTAADLSSGTVYYTPESGDLAFRFEVRRDGATVAEERVRVVEGIKQVAVSSPANPIPRTAPALVSAPKAATAFRLRALREDPLAYCVPQQVLVDLPSFMITTKFLAGSSMSLMSSSGLPLTNRRSARAPGSITPSLPG